MKKVRSGSAHVEARATDRASTIRGGTWNAKNALVVVVPLAGPRPGKIPRLITHLREVSCATFCLPILETSSRRSYPPNQGKVRDIYSFADDPTPADRRDRSHLRVRLRARLGHSRQGQGPDAAVGLLVRAKPATSSPNHLRSTRVDDYPGRGARPRRRAARPLDARAKTEPSRSNAWPAGISRARAGRNTRGAARSAASRSRRACGNRTGCPSRSSRRPPRPRPATTITSPTTRPRAIVGRDVIERLRDLTLALYSRGAAHAEPRGIIVADTKFEFGRSRRPEARARSS